MAGIRQKRQDVIRMLVRSEHIRTQAELVSRLGENGCEVTQATVSRDITDLGLEKGKGGIYVLPEDHRLHALVTGAMRETRRAGNQVLLLCDPGTASSVAAALDAANCPGVLGCIAGDDTILAICADDSCGKDFQASMDALLIAR